MQLVKFSKHNVYKPETILIEENKPFSAFHLIMTGQADIKYKKKHICQLGPGSFAGEMAFLDNKNTNASIISTQELTSLSWSKPDLLKMQKKKPKLFAHLEHALGLNLIKKIEKSNEIKLSTSSK